MRDLLQDILDNWNIWHRYQRRMINRGACGVDPKVVITERARDQKDAKWDQMMKRRVRALRQKRAVKEQEVKKGV